MKKVLKKEVKRLSKKVKALKAENKILLEQLQGLEVKPKAKKKAVRNNSFIRTGLTTEGFNIIKEVAREMSERADKYHDNKLKHITRTKLLSELKSRGYAFTVYSITAYLKEMKSEVMLISQNQGYKYTKALKETA